MDPDGQHVNTVSHRETESAARTTHLRCSRGVNAEGTGPASSTITEYTPIASPHNTLFFKDCVNYFDRGSRVSVHGNPSERVRTVADNNYNTFTREKDLDINIAVNGQPTRVDAIAVMGVDIEGHSAEPTGGTRCDPDIPTASYLRL